MKLILDNIKKTFVSKNVLDNINFEFESGKIYGLLGRNGAGKTTFFNCVSQNMNLEEGNILLQEEHRHKILLEEVGYVLATPTLPEYLTGYEFIKFFKDINDKVETQSVEDYLQLVKIAEEDAHKLIKNYSFGMKNKLQILCPIIAKSKVILLDEPLTSFDIIAAAEIKKIFTEMKHDHVIIFSTHIMQLAVDICDEIVILKDGKMKLMDNSIIKKDDFEDEILRELEEVNYE